LNVEFPARIVINAMVNVYASTLASAATGSVEMECGAQTFAVGGGGNAVDAGPRTVLQFRLVGNDFIADAAPINTVVDLPPGNYNVRVVCRRLFVNAVTSVVTQASLTAIAVAR
jgi:hypothetical protein